MERTTSHMRPQLAAFALVVFTILALVAAPAHAASPQRCIAAHTAFQHVRIEAARTVAHIVQPRWNQMAHYRIDIDAMNAHRLADARAYQQQRAVQARSQFMQRTSPARGYADGYGNVYTSGPQYRPVAPRPVVRPPRSNVYGR